MGGRPASFLSLGFERDGDSLFYAQVHNPICLGNRLAAVSVDVGLRFVQSLIHMMSAIRSLNDLEQRLHMDMTFFGKMIA